MNFEDVRQIALTFPGSEEYIQFGRPALRVGKHFLASIAKIDKDTLVLKVPDPLDREIRLAANPALYYLTDHYASFDALLIRLPRSDENRVALSTEISLFRFACDLWLRGTQPVSLLPSYQGIVFC